MGQRIQTELFFMQQEKFGMKGGDPYNAVTLVSVPAERVNLSNAVFAYPPQAAGLCIPMASSGYPQAEWGWCFVNLLSLLLGAALVLRFMTDRRPVVLSLALLLLLGNPFATHVLWMGQQAFLSTAAFLPHGVSLSGLPPSSRGFCSALLQSNLNSVPFPPPGWS